MAVSAADVRSALALPESSTSAAQNKKGKQRDGIPRELYRLIGPSMPSLAVPKPPRLKQKPNLGVEVKWEKRKFKNPARKDGLELEHWVRASTDPNEEYPFAKYNTRPPIHRYSEEEYANWLQDEQWNKEETDYLFSVLNEYDMRWYIVHDRYDYTGPKKDEKQPHKKRTLEDLKERYYSVCRKLIRNRNAHVDEATRASMLSNFQFDKEREVTRRKYIESLDKRGQDALEEEEALYIEIKRLEQNERKFKKDRDELLRVLAGIDSGLPDVIEDADLSLIAVDTKRSKKKGTLEPDTPTTPSASAASRPVVKSLPTDALHCITRTEPSSSLPSTKAAHTAAYVRSYKIPVAKASMAQRVQEIMAELGLSAGRLVMPTAGNVAQMESLMDAIYVLIDAKKAVDKVEMDIRTAKERLNMRGSEGADEGAGDQLMHSRSQSVASGRGRKQARRSASVASSVDASVSARPTKRQRR
ncbi:uncharacterized protein SCHCODRAFT_01141637 [Schizophyllum commune H4-8]|uniref:uncharacterized protein n=1 Tax=Schizophyllum commune (strain H4-8 / FGSC 9210) TaxID=578458 RepID=UPI002160E60C|nr:uncharacterized protein SCHCODRAFT_01141637 [Schizophyllum commune H4-8]KAI5893877.1 hypothetical protein SCHCODRAFT_01141637 [Schizophyllum commune H4-8]